MPLSWNEIKSRALDYFPGIGQRDLPRHVVVCDFARLRLYDLTPPPPRAGEGVAERAVSSNSR